jgi:hypothetical protein
LFSAQLPPLDRRPGHIERTRIFDRDVILQNFPVVDQSEAFDDVQLVRMRRAVIVGDGPLG